METVVTQAAQELKLPKGQQVLMAAAKLDNELAEIAAGAPGNAAEINARLEAALRALQGESASAEPAALATSMASVAIGASREQPPSPPWIQEPQALLAVDTSQLGLSAATASYRDARRGFGPHNAIDFSVNQPQVRLDELLVSLLSREDAAVLISDWGNRIDFEKTAPSKSEVVLFVDSNDKARSRGHAAEGAKTTQEEDFKGAGLYFAGDIAATIVCATAVMRAKTAGLDLRKPVSSWGTEQKEALARLGGPVADLLSKLRDGVVRSCSGALYVAVGRLRANDVLGSSSADDWAFGCRSCEE